MLDSDRDAKLSQQVKQIQELIEKIGPEDGRSVFVYENIGLSLRSVRTCIKSRIHYYQVVLLIIGVDAFVMFNVVPLVTIVPVVIFPSVSFCVIFWAVTMSVIKLAAKVTRRYPI
jgi:hypothetical protein